jgi:hypothetical protein
VLTLAITLAGAAALLLDHRAAAAI